MLRGDSFAGGQDYPDVGGPTDPRINPSVGLPDF